MRHLTNSLCQVPTVDAFVPQIQSGAQCPHQRNVFQQPKHHLKAVPQRVSQAGFSFPSRPNGPILTNVLKSPLCHPKRKFINNTTYLPLTTNHFHALIITRKRNKMKAIYAEITYSEIIWVSIRKDSRMLKPTCRITM